MADFEIDPELRDWLPTLSEESFANLKVDIKRSGCRDPLVVWKERKVLIDGHHRYRICSELDVEFETKELSFPGIVEVKIWMATNQLARRNLTDFQRGEMALNLKPLFEMKAKERQSAAGGSKTQKIVGSLKEKFPEAPKGQTRDEVGRIVGMSGKQIDKVDQIVKSGNKAVIEQARAAQISINKAHHAIKKTSAKKAPIKQPVIDQSIAEGWKALRNETFGRLRDYCRKNVTACSRAAADLRELAKDVIGYLEKHRELVKQQQESAKKTAKPKDTAKSSKVMESTVFPETSKPTVATSTKPTEVSAATSVANLGNKPAPAPVPHVAASSSAKATLEAVSPTRTTPPAKPSTPSSSRASEIPAAKAPSVPSQSVPTKSNS